MSFEVFEVELKDSKKINLNQQIANTEGKVSVEEVSAILEAEHMNDIVCIEIPEEANFGENMIIATGKSFKLQQFPNNFIPIADKELAQTGWVAMDLGNIILHLFLHDVRQYYDLETLWKYGPDEDKKINQAVYRPTNDESHISWESIVAEVQNSRNNGK